jgi:hypothetical protein
MNDIWKMMFGAAAGWIAAHFIVAIIIFIIVVI